MEYWAGLYKLQVMFEPNFTADFINLMISTLYLFTMRYTCRILVRLILLQQCNLLQLTLDFSMDTPVYSATYVGFIGQ